MLKDDILKYFYYFYLGLLKKSVWYFLKIISFGDNLHES